MSPVSGDTGVSTSKAATASAFNRNSINWRGNTSDTTRGTGYSLRDAHFPVPKILLIFSRRLCSLPVSRLLDSHCTFSARDPGMLECRVYSGRWAGLFARARAGSI